MQLNQFRAPLLAAFSFGTLLSPTLAQEAPAPGSTAPSSAAPGAAADTTGLPGFLLPVPAGTVEMGMTWDQLFEAACQVASPGAPKDAPKKAAEKLLQSLRAELRTLGRKKVDVPAFLLAKWPTKNSEYEPYVKAGAGKVRMPLHWWTVGRSDDFEKRREEIDRQFPKNKFGIVLYWDANYKELPYALKDDKGQPTDDQPVTMISWRDANDFAGSLGMRLPTEAELTRASRGDSANIWPSDKPDGGGAFSNALLQALGIADAKDMKLRPVGSGPVGPFGHTDLHGHVWQFVANLGFGPVNGLEAFEAAWKDLTKDVKALKGLDKVTPPEWRADQVLAKGGAYNAGSAPTMLMIDTRRPYKVDDTYEMLGFRLAKSMKPGYDMIYSRLQGTYNRNWFGEEQDADLTNQFGAEHYELAANGFPTAYHGVSFAPVNFLAKEKSMELAKLVERSQLSPMLVGTLVVTVPIAEPAVPAGIYSLLFRHAGVPKELTEAIKAGHKSLTDKSKKKDDDKEKDAAAQEKERKWRDVVTRFGLTDDDIASKDAADGNLGFVRIEGLQVPIEHSVFLLYGNEGKMLASWKAAAPKPVAAPVPGTLTMSAGKDGKTAAKLHFTALALQGAKKHAEFVVELLLDMAAPTNDKPWRQSTATPGK